MLNAVVFERLELLLTRRALLSFYLQHAAGF
jgi:hypothetical protein